MISKKNLFSKSIFVFVFFSGLFLIFGCSEKQEENVSKYVPEPYLFEEVIIDQEEFASVHIFSPYPLEKKYDMEREDTSAKGTSISSSFNSYQDTSKQFTFFYPKDWKINIENDSILVAYSPEYNDNVAEFHVEKIEKNNSSLEEIRDKIVAFMQKEHPKSTIKKTEKIPLGERTLIKISYNDSDKEISFLHTICEENGEMYIMSYVGKEELFEKYFYEANEMIQKFMVNKKE
jgi:hypothetical protein